MRQYIKVIGALTLDELKDFASTLLRRMRVTLLVGGNIDEAGARAAAAVVKDTLAPLALDPSQIPYSRAVMLPPGNRLHHFPGFNEADDNGVAAPPRRHPILKAVPAISLRTGCRSLLRSLAPGHARLGLAGPAGADRQQAGVRDPKDAAAAGLHSARIAGIWVAFFQECQRCGQVFTYKEQHQGVSCHDIAGI